MPAEGDKQVLTLHRDAYPQQVSFSFPKFIVKLSSRFRVRSVLRYFKGFIAKGQWIQRDDVS